MPWGCAAAVAKGQAPHCIPVDRGIVSKGRPAVTTVGQGWPGPDLAGSTSACGLAPLTQERQKHCFHLALASR